MGEERVGRFEKVVLPYLDDAYTLARYLLRDEHDAQDAVQDAVLRALRYFETFRGADARPWLLAIVRNCCYNRHQDRRTEHLSLDSIDDTTMAVAAPGGADDIAIESSERKRVQIALDSLPAELREVIILREVNELSYREISEVVGAPMGTVMSRLSRARNRLADAIGADSRKAG